MISGGITRLQIFLCVVLFRRVVHKESLKDFLLHLDWRGILLFIEGALLGVVGVLAMAWFCVLSGMGELTIDPNALPHTLDLLLGLCIIHFGVSLLEEGICRGYMLPRLLQRYGAMTAVLVPSVIFSVLHYPDLKFVGANIWSGLFNITLFGVVFSVAVLRTGSLMFPLGYHMLWNTTQGILRSSQERGVATVLNFSQPDGIGVFVETEWPVTLVLCLLLVYLVLRFRGKRSRTLTLPMESKGQWG